MGSNGRARTIIISANLRCEMLFLLFMLLCCLLLLFMLFMQLARSTLDNP